MKKFKVVPFIIVLIVMGLLSISCNEKPTKPSSNSEETSKSVNTNGIEAKYNGKVPFKDLGGQVIKIASWWDLTPIEGSNKTSDQRIERVKYIEKTYNCKIEWTALIETEMMNQIATSVAANNPIADFTYIMNTNIPMSVGKKYLEPMENISAFNIKDSKWPQFVINYGLINDKHYTFDMEPVFFPRVVIYWNKTKFQKNGWENLYELQKNKQWNWEKFLEISQKASKDIDGDGKQDTYGFTGISGLFQTALVLGNNAEFVKYDVEGKPQYAGDSKNSLEALQFLQDLINKYKVVDEPKKPTWDYYMNSFMEGKSAMAAGELYLYSMLEEMEDDWGIVCPPMGPQGTEYTSPANFFGVMAMLANNPKKQEAGFVFDLLTQPYGDEDPIEKGFATIVKDRESLETIKIISEKAAKYNNSYTFKTAETTINLAVNEIINAKKTPAVAMTAIKTAVQKLIDDDFQAFNKK